MKSLLILTIYTLCFCFSSKAQYYNQQQINELTKAYTNVGDTVGIYVERGNKWELMKPITFCRTKVNALGSALTYGIAKTKLKMEYEGNTSPYIFSGGSAHFRIYFGLVPPKKAATYYMFSESFSLRDFAIAKFEVKKKVRRLVQSSFSIWTGSKSGVKSEDDIKFDATEIREGVYDVHVQATPGEYCFVFTKHGAGGFKDVFDFTME